MVHDTVQQHWLLLIYRVPQDPPGRRTYVWRQLKALGAIYLQQAVGLLPDQLAVRAALETLADRIRAFEGDVSLLETHSPSVEWEQEMIRRFNQARDAEFLEVIENVERFEDEIARESQRGKYTFAELEDSEADWEKIERWLARIDARDFFTAPGRAGVVAALERGRARLEQFAAAVYAHEGVQDDNGHAETEHH